MRKFIFTIFCISTIFIGLGGIFNNFDSILKSDKKVLIVLKKTPISDENKSEIKVVQNISANGSFVRVFRVINQSS